MHQFSNWTRKLANQFNCFTFLIVTCVIGQISLACNTRFDGFGVHLGGIGEITEDTAQDVINHLYFDLKLRHFRTSYEPYFSPAPDQYDINCDPSTSTCRPSWNLLLEILSNKTTYPDPLSVFASVWSPPYYMKDEQFRLMPSSQLSYYYFLKNITAQIQAQYGIAVEAISPVNEPDNVFAPWDHCNMNAHQLCSMVASFNDSLISLCPENSYFWITQLFTNYRFNPQSVDCRTACEVIATHAYALNVNSTSPNLFKAHYDLIPYNSSTLLGKRIWQTEVSSTYELAELHQMEEALDLATNVINFVGNTCVERYYFWLAFTQRPSGESLIWGGPRSRPLNGESSAARFLLPKKYFVYQHFTRASFKSSRSRGGSELHPVFVQMCNSSEFISADQDEVNGSCLQFDETHTVFLNRQTEFLIINDERINCNCGLCCTTETADYSCDFNKYVLPPLSVCTCKGGNCLV